MQQYPRHEIRQRKGISRRHFVQAASAGVAVPASVWPLAIHAQTSQTGVAVLVGNTSYNPNDEDIAPALKCIYDLSLQLKRFGFTVVALHDATLPQVQAELDKLQQAVAASPDLAGLFYFVGHGFQSNAENLLLPAGGDLRSKPADLAKASVSLERDVFTRLKRTAGRTASVILIDACRTPDKPLSPTEGYNQTLPPEGCHVAFATGPGKRAFAPRDADKYTLFTEMLVAELQVTDPSKSVFLTLERVRSKVLKRVNSIDVIVRNFGANAQMPELASNVSGDPAWVVIRSAFLLPSSPKPPEGGKVDVAAGGPAELAELEAIQRLASPEEAAQRLKALLGKLPEGDLADVAKLRQQDLEKVLRAVREARLNLDTSSVTAGKAERVAEDVQRALRGDKYAALRVAEALGGPPPAGTLIERSDYGRWMIFAAYLGNGIAAYRLSEYFRNVDRRDTESSRFANLARANQYTPPRQLTSGR